ncbi:hypothetical protein GGI23_000788 [Coemansia sp. RSA 2559]|nr:hypothetical protein GGI23_000788 [Coemansia sp. RSA 2559]
MNDSSDDSDTAFPSFASAPVTSTANPENPERKRKSSERHHKHARKRQHRQRDRNRKDNEATSSPHRAEKSTNSVLEELDRDGHIIVDKRGDLDLRIFNQSARPGAPKFERFRNNNRVLGLKDALIDPRARRGDPEIRLVYGGKLWGRYVDIDWADHSEGVERVMPSTKVLEGQDVMGKEFIQIEDVPASLAATQDTNEYDNRGLSGWPNVRSLEGMAKQKQENIMSFDKGGAEINSTTNQGGAAAAAAVDLEARIRTNKHDIAAWMELVDCQKAIALSTFKTANRRESKRTIIELQLEVFRRALENNPESHELVLGYLELCKEVMDIESLTNEWEKMADRATDPRIFIEFVVFCQGLTARRSVSWMIDVYSRSLKRVLRCASRQDMQTRTRVLVAAMELLHCLCLFLRDAGYFERAVATYQAILEWYLLAPTDVLDLTYGHKMGLFEAFWDTGAKRIGHAGAKGWFSFTGDNNDCKRHLDIIDEAIFPRMATLVHDFYSAELCGMERCFNAATTPASVLQIDSPLIDSIDPFSVTIFEDVAPVLVDTEWNESAAGALIDRFLQFSGVVGPRTFVFTHDTLYNKDTLTLDDISCTFFPQGGNSILSGRFDPTRWIQECSSFPFVSLPCGLDSMDMPLPYKKYCLWTSPSSDVSQEITRNALELLALTEIRLPLDMRLQICVVLIEWTFLGSAEKGKNMSERILGVYPTSMLLWNTFAKMLARTGDWDEARKVWANSLAFVAKLQESEQAWSIVIRKSWAALEAMHGRGLGVAAKIACAETSVELQMLVKNNSDGIAPEVLPEDVERAQRLVKGNEQHWGACTKPEVRSAAAALSLWLAYAKSLDMQDVDKVYADVASDNRCCNERLRMDLCAVHFFHITNSKAHRAQDFRKHVQPSVELYPYNTVLWEMFLHCEARLKMSGRVRWTLEKITKRNKKRDPCLQMVFVYVRMRLDQQAGARSDVRIANIRKYLGDATCEGESNSPLIWVTAFHFEQRQGSPKRAKKVLVAAIRQCPWIKEFLMVTLCGKALEIGFTDRERSAFLRGMATCGIRINTIIE